MRGELEGAKAYREINYKNIRKGMIMTKKTWIEGQRQEAETCLRNNNSKKAYQLVKYMYLTTEKQGKSTTIQDNSGKCLIEEPEILDRRTEYCSDLYTYKTGIQQYLTAHRYQVKSLFLSYEEKGMQQMGYSARVDIIPT